MHQVPTLKLLDPGEIWREVPKEEPGQRGGAGNTGVSSYLQFSTKTFQYTGYSLRLPVIEIQPKLEYRKEKGKYFHLLNRKPRDAAGFRSSNGVIEIPSLLLLALLSSVSSQIISPHLVARSLWKTFTSVTSEEKLDSFPIILAKTPSEACTGPGHITFLSLSKHYAQNIPYIDHFWIVCSPWEPGAESSS